MEKAEIITREEAEKNCIEIADGLRQGVLNEIEVLKVRLFDDAATEDELEPIWIMAGDFLGHIIQHMKDTIKDIEAGCYITKEKELTA